jgi:hypothetical protein
MVHTVPSDESIEQSLQDGAQPQPDPVLDGLIRTIREAIEARDQQPVIAPSPRARSHPTADEVPVSQPPRVRFNRD